MGATPAHFYDPMHDLKLPEPPPRPHHWRLKNLRRMQSLIAAAYGQPPLQYLRSGSIDGYRDLTFFAMSACLAGNCWALQRYQQLPLEPPAPDDVRFGGPRYMRGPPAPAEATAYLRSDGTLVLYFRGTFTLSETAVDVKSLWSGWQPLPGSDARFLYSLWSAYQRRDDWRLSLADFAQSCYTSVNLCIIVGHSLGGAMAQLAAYDACRAGKQVSLVTIGGASGGDAAFCQVLQAAGATVLTVVNAKDLTPWLHPLLRHPCHCCRIIAVDAAAGSGLISSLLTHDPLYYAAALYRLGTASKLPRAQLCCTDDVNAFVHFDALMPVGGASQRDSLHSKIHFVRMQY